MYYEYDISINKGTTKHESLKRFNQNVIKLLIRSPLRICSGKQCNLHRAHCTVYTLIIMMKHFHPRTWDFFIFVAIAKMKQIIQQSKYLWAYFHACIFLKIISLIEKWLFLLQKIPNLNISDELLDRKKKLPEYQMLGYRIVDIWLTVEVHKRIRLLLLVWRWAVIEATAWLPYFL